MAELISKSALRDLRQAGAIAKMPIDLPKADEKTGDNPSHPLLVKTPTLMIRSYALGYGGSVVVARLEDGRKVVAVDDPKSVRGDTKREIDQIIQREESRSA